MPQPERSVIGAIIVLVIILAVISASAYIAMYPVKRLPPYNPQDAQLIRKVELAVEQDLTPEEIEQSVGTQAVINTWRPEPKYGCEMMDMAGDPPFSAPPINLLSAQKVMAWMRPVQLSDGNPRMVGIL